MTIKNFETGEVLMNFEGAVEIQAPETGKKSPFGMHTNLMSNLLVKGSVISKKQIVISLIKMLFW